MTAVVISPAALHLEHGVVDHTAQMYGDVGLFVAEGAAYLAPPGVPPSHALAERRADLAALDLLT
jgi:hypothetical protein